MSHMEDATSHIETERAHTEDASNHTEVTTCYKKDATSHIVALQPTQML